MKIIALGYNEYLLMEESGDREIGKLSCSSWTNKAEIFSQEAHYLINSTGFWGMTKELSKQEQRLYKLNLSWHGHYEIRSLMAETNQFFIVKAKSLAYKDCVLLDKQNNELLTISISYEGFSTIKVNLNVPDIEKIHSLAADNLLIYMALYCANRLSMMMMASRT